MMATTTFRDLPNTEDKTLFLVMDGENNLTGDPATIDRMMERKETTEVRIIRLLTRSADSEEIDDSDDEDVLPRVKLTVEEILPENAEEELKTGDSAVPPDFVDPLSQLDNEQMLKLKKALASEQAKQLLGDNVTAMLDVLSVDDNPTMFLQNSIRRDHCYTPLSPSADPRGASFVLSDASLKKQKVLSKIDTVKPSGSGLAQQPKTNTSPSKNSDVENENEDDEDSDSSNDSDSDGRDRSSDSDYRDRNSSIGFRGRKKSGRGGPWGSRRMRGGIRGRKPLKIRGRVRKDTDEINSEITEDIQAQPTTPVEISPPATVNILKRGRPRKVDPSGTPKSSASASQASTPEPPVVIPIDHVAAKVYSADAIRLGRPQLKSEEERKRDMARIMHKLDASGQNGSRQIKLKNKPVAPIDAGYVRPQVKIIAVSEKRPPLPKMTDDLSQMIETLEDGLEQETISVAKVLNKPIRTYVRKDENKIGKLNLENKTINAPLNVAVAAITNSPSENVMGGKYPRRENRKLPSHFADTIGPELFSSQDIIRKRIAAQSTEEATANKGKIMGKVVQKSLMGYVVKSSSADSSSGVPADTPESVSTEEVGENVKSSASEPTHAETVNSIETILEGFNDPDQTIEKETNKADLPKIEASAKNVVASTLEIDKKNKKDKIVLGRDVNVRRKSAAKHESGAENEPKKVSLTENVRIESPDVAMKDDVIKKERKVIIENKLIRKASLDVSSGEKIAPKNIVESPQKVVKMEIKTEEALVAIGKQSDEQSPATDDRKRNAVKRRRSDEVSDLDSDIDDTLSEASWNSEDDPERLWCICQKPHNNRFMICCDACEDWFHGKCVGITKSIGKQMEQDGLEWSCPPCSKKKRAEEKEKESKGELKQSKLSGFAIKRSSDESNERKCIMCKGPVRENSIYCSDKCIRSHSQKAIAQFSSTNKNTEKPESNTLTSVKKEDHVIVMDPTRKKVLAGSSAPTLNNLATWLKENPSYHVLYQKQPNKASTLSNVKGVKKVIQFHPAMKVAGERSGQTKLIVSPNSKHIKIVSRPIVPQQQNQKIVQVNVKKNTVVNVKPENRIETKFKTLESPKLVEKKTIESPKLVQRRRKEKHSVLSDLKSPTHSASKMDDSREEKRGVSVASEQVIRDSVRKTLGEALKTRKADCKDLESKEIDIESLATKIEDRLFKHFDNKVDVKYKSKYRSLVFNIKDVKNQTLYRKILENSISPKVLVRLTADEMASQELAQWRERENLHQLEMIKKTELELMSLGQTFILKSHKGEEVIEKDLKVAAVAAALDPNTSAKELVSAINSVTNSSPDPASTDKKAKASETSLMKMNKKEKERRREKERSHKSDRSRSKGSRHSKSRRRSRSRSKDRRRSSRSSRSRRSRDSRDKDKHKEKVKDNDKDKEKVVTVEEKPAEFSTFAQVDDSVNDPVSDEAEYDPASVVPVKSPETFVEDQEDPNELASVWAGKISMTEVGEFHGIALEVYGDCSNVDVDVGDKVSVVGRIPYNVVWDYLIKMEKIATKDIIIMQILPLDIDVDQANFSTLFRYLSKRSRTGVGSRKSSQIKDFYLYPHLLGTPLPKVISHITIPSTKENGEILLGIMIKTNRSSRPVALPLPPPVTSTRLKLPLPLPKSPLDEPELALTSPPSGDGANIDPRKRKIRVQVEVPKTPSVNEDDSPYSPASSDEDLPPLKLPRKTASSNALTNSDATPKPVDSNNSFAAAAQIQKKIEEMNRAIEEETLQIQNLASSVKVPLHTIVTPTIASTLNIATAAAVVPQIDIAIKALKTFTSSAESPLSVDKSDSTPKEVLIDEPIPMELDIPLPPTPATTDESSEKEVASEPDTYIAPAAPPLLLPEVAQISIPSDLHEILANINKQSKQPVTAPVKHPSPTTSPPPKSPEPLPPGVDDADISPIKQPLKPKPDRNTVFESAGVPAFAPFKKPIKFDLKLKDRELEERPSEVNNDIDERNTTALSSLDQRIALALDQDDRESRIPTMSFGDRDERSTRSSAVDSKPIAAASSKDKDDRLSRHSLTSDRDYRRPNRWRNESYKRRGDKERSGKWKDDLEDEWAGSIRRHEDEARRRNRSIRTKEIEMLKQEVDRKSD